MKNKEVTYTINCYDDEGVQFDECLQIWIDNSVILRFDTIEQLIQFKCNIEICIKQIKDELG